MFADRVDNIHAKSFDPLLQPEMHDRMDFLTNFRIAPIQIDLLRSKQGQGISILFDLRPSTSPE